jgi:peptidoglycan/xylan/chitin deacetylase (PgdA/CDA1 family)
VKERSIASLSLDLDNQWSYMKTHGDSGWESFPSYLGILVPRVLAFLKQRRLRITFFVVGQDAALEANAEPLRALATAGHEIANHSFHHEPWLHLYTLPEVESEIARAEEAIEQATGQKPVGFRGPGYSVSETVTRVLARRGYLYDASTLPTFIGPLARSYYFMTAQLSDEERQRRKALFGSWRDAFLPIRSHILDRDENRIVEIPVTTMPLFRLPIHVSYILYLSRFSRRLALLYARTAVTLCRVSNISPSLLLHPLDFLGGDDVRELAFFPAMDLSGEQKQRLVGEVLDLFGKSFRWVSVQEHARHVFDRG